MSYLTQPSLSLSRVNSTSFSAAITDGDNALTHALYYWQASNPTRISPGPTIVGLGSLGTLSGLQVNGVYQAFAIATNGTTAYSLPSPLSSVSLAASDTLSAAFHTRFNASPTLSTLLPGGLWTGEVPEGTAPPYGWLDISRIITSPTFEQQFEAGKLTLHLLTIGAEAAEALALQVKAWFDYQRLTFSSNATTCIQLLPRDYRLVCEMIRYKDSSLIYRVILTYHILIQKDR